MADILYGDIMSEQSESETFINFTLTGWHLYERDFILYFVLASLILAMALQ